VGLQLQQRQDLLRRLGREQLTQLGPLLEVHVDHIGEVPLPEELHQERLADLPRSADDQGLAVGTLLPLDQVAEGIAAHHGGVGHGVIPLRASPKLTE